MDTGELSAGKDIGTVGVFERLIDDQLLTFNNNGDGTFTDKETGSTWDILGEAIDGPMKGMLLSSIPHHDTFWFAWAAFIPPDTLAE